MLSCEVLPRSARQLAYPARIDENTHALVNAVPKHVSAEILVLAGAMFGGAGGILVMVGGASRRRRNGTTSQYCDLCRLKRVQGHVSP